MATQQLKHEQAYDQYNTKRKHMLCCIRAEWEVNIPGVNDLGTLQSEVYIQINLKPLGT